MTYGTIRDTVSDEAAEPIWRSSRIRYATPSTTVLTPQHVGSSHDHQASPANTGFRAGGGMPRRSSVRAGPRAASPAGQLMSSAAVPLPVQLWYLGAGHMVSAAVQAAAKLGIADLLASGPESVVALADRTQTDPPSLWRLLRALASVGVFEETTGGVFAQSAMSEFLCSDTPGSLADLFIANAQPDNWGAFADLDYSVRTGKSALEHRTGKNFFQAYSDPYYAEAFHRGMSGLSEMHSFAVSQSYAFSDYRTLCDVGGGYGHLLGTLLEANPQLSGILFDTPDVIEIARSTPAKEILLQRAELVPGDFFASVPDGADCYLMKFILHDWDDEHAKRILQTVRAAMTAKGTRLLIVDAVIPPGNEPSMNKILDLQMLVALSGRERTEQEFRELLSSASLHLNRVIPTPSPLSIVEATTA
jgi:hypothetical protein